MWEGVCFEPYHCTLDVCTTNKVRKYGCMCEMAVCLYTAVETHKEYFVKYQNMILEMQWTDLSIKDVGRGIFGDGCDGPSCMDMALTRSKT